MVTDPIGDFLVRIKNAGAAGLSSAAIPYSEMKLEIAELLAKEGYLASITKKGKKVKKILEVGLAYSGREPRVSGFTRVSKPSRRVYMKVKDMHGKAAGQSGLVVLSTPKGILTDRDAQKEHVGGEVLFKIW